MNLDMNSFAGQFKNVWKGISFSHKFIMISITLAFLIGIAGVTQWARKPDFGLLYGELSPKESGEIINHLREVNIPYKISGNGTMILIPSDKIYEMRLKFAGEGLPREETGYELLDKVGFGTSDFIQKVNYRRAVQGELAKTIKHLDYVDWAQVHLAMPEESLFVEDEKPPTASVVLKLKTGGKLKPERVASIVHLVSSSVEGLTPENVTVADTRGNLLSEKESPSSTAGTSNDQLEIKKKIEEYYVAKAQDILDRIVGAGKSVVRVTAELDFRHVDEKQIEFDPDRRVPKVQTVTTRISGGAPFSGGGVPGMQANLNLSQSSILQSAGSSEEEETAQTQYELSKVERVVYNHGANLRRLSVAVLVDGKYEEVESEDGKIQQAYVPRSNDEIKRIASLVKQALGVNAASRNDSFEIQNVQFYEPDYTAEEESLKKEQQKEFMLKLAKNGSLGITVLMFLMFMLRSMKKIKKKAGHQVEMQHVSSAGIPAKPGSAKMQHGDTAGRDKLFEQLRISKEQQGVQYTKEELEAAVEEMLAMEEAENPEQVMEGMKREKKRKMIIGQMQKEPDLTATALKRWIEGEYISS
ncbi:MAG: flagellar M-ring protein FliF [Candidatus Kuenenia sp.]|nr:flagellar M-ring protein FliF [Candidatus Kuenenia hertensis]